MSTRVQQAIAPREQEAQPLFGCALEYGLENAVRLLRNSNESPFVD